MKHHAPKALAATLAVAALLLSACGGSTAAEESKTPTANSCDKASLATLESGVLTIATDDPAYDPWFSENDPSNGNGYESAVAYAIATQLGFSKDEVKWTRVAFNSAIAPGDKTFDFDINEFSITADRAKVVDFSTGYYDVKQALITVKGSKIEGATTLAELKDAKLGAQIGTTSYDVIANLIQPNEDPSVFDTNDIAKQALVNGQIDGLIVDLPTAFYLTAVEITDGLIVGQFESDGAGEQFGVVLNKDSAITKCVSDAVDALRADGTLAGIEAQWLSQVVDAPVIK